MTKITLLGRSAAIALVATALVSCGTMILQIVEGIRFNAVVDEIVPAPNSTDGVQGWFAQHELQARPPIGPHPRSNFGEIGWQPEPFEAWLDSGEDDELFDGRLKIRAKGRAFATNAGDEANWEKDVSLLVTLELTTHPTGPALFRVEKPVTRDEENTVGPNYETKVSNEVRALVRTWLNEVETRFHKWPEFKPKNPPNPLGEGQGMSVMIRKKDTHTYKLLPTPPAPIGREETEEERAKRLAPKYVIVRTLTERFLVFLATDKPRTP